MNQVGGEIFSGFDPIDELLHHLGGAHIGVDLESEINDGSEVDVIIHDVSSIHSTNRSLADII